MGCTPDNTRLRRSVLGAAVSAGVSVVAGDARATIAERCANARRCVPGAARGAPGARIAAPNWRGDVVAEETATDFFAASGAMGARAIAIVLRALETATSEWRASETAARCMRRRRWQWGRDCGLRWDG